MTYDQPPKGETPFPSLKVQSYHRSYQKCDFCGVFVGRLSHELSGFYSSEYVHSTYGGRLLENYLRIMRLAPERSDNIHRVHAIRAFMDEWWISHPTCKPKVPTVLDVGSGLCVFLARMKEVGWQGTALDPDSHAAEHARRTVGVMAVCGDFMAVSHIGRYDLIAFNKVLEHVADPVAMLEKSRELLLPHGVVYVEVPDGEAAIREGWEREEFYIEHLWVFSVISLALLFSCSGLHVQRIERLREPSGKYTLRCWGFLP